MGSRHQLLEMFCNECGFSSRRPPQVLNQNLHIANGDDDEGILPRCQACKAPKIPPDVKYDPKRYAPSSSSGISQETIQAVENANPINTAMKPAPAVPVAASGDRMPLTEHNIKRFNRADGYGSLGNWIKDIRVFGLAPPKEVGRSFMKYRGSSLTALSDNDADFVLADSGSEDYLLFGIGDWSDQARRVVPGVEDFVMVRKEDACELVFEHTSR